MLKTLYLMCIIAVLTLNSQTATLEPIPNGSLSNTCMFSLRHTAAFLCSGPRFSIVLGDHGKHQQEIQKCEKRDTKYTLERTVVYSRRAETRRQGMQWDCVHRITQFFATLCTFLNDHESAWSMVYKQTLLSRQAHKCGIHV